MKGFSRVMLAVCCTSVLYACAVGAPKRADYGGADNIAAVQDSMILGTWRTRILNPVKGEETGSSEFTLNADGTMSGTSQSSADGGQMVFEMAGTWQITGEHITTTIESMKETSGNQVAAFAQSLVASLTKGRTTKLNVFESSADRLVVVAEDTGQAQEWTRIQ
jgi:hypothetical protein